MKVNLREKNSDKRRCPLCRWPLDNGDSVMKCPHDKISYHFDCLSEMASCRCRSRPVVKQKAQPIDRTSIYQQELKDEFASTLVFVMFMALSMVMWIFVSKVLSFMTALLLTCYLVGDKR